MPGNKTAGLTVASCLVTKVMQPDNEGEAPKAVIRPYTPTSPPDAAGARNAMKTCICRSLHSDLCTFDGIMVCSPHSRCRLAGLLMALARLMLQMASLKATITTAKPSPLPK